MTYAYDALNRLEMVLDYGANEPPLAHSYTYDKVGNLASLTYANGVTHTWSYNTLNRLTNLDLANGFGGLNSYTYTLSAAGMRTRMTETSGRVVDYEYDNLYRLTSESISGDPYGIDGTTSYTYDLVGNRTNRTSSVSFLTPVQNLSVSANDWLTTDTYDDNGNTTGSDAGSDVYDWKNRLIRRTTADGQIIDITYNAKGDRVSKSTGISSVHYLVDRNNLTGYAQVVEELNSSLNVERTYTYGLDLIAQSQLMPVDNPDHWETAYYLYDGLGTVRGLADETGLVTDAYFYDAYGVLLNVIGTTPNVYLYTGEQFDADLGMYFLRARYMEPGTGRFWTMDTYEGRGVDPATLHKYLYVHGNPVMGIDPSGRSLVDLLMSFGLQKILRAIKMGKNVHRLRKAQARLCRIAAIPASALLGSYKKLQKYLRRFNNGNGPGLAAHHVFQNAMMITMPLYRKSIGIAIALIGKKTQYLTPHYFATQVQIQRANNPDIRATAFVAMRAAGCRAKDATTILDAVDGLHEMMGIAMNLGLL